MALLSCLLTYSRHQVNVMSTTAPCSEHARFGIRDFGDPQLGAGSGIVKRSSW